MEKCTYRAACKKKPDWWNTLCNKERTAKYDSRTEGVPSMGNAAAKNEADRGTANPTRSTSSSSSSKHTKSISTTTSSSDDDQHEEESATWRTVEKVYCNKYLFEVKPDMLDRCVDNILEIEELNIRWLPDAVERKIYSYVVATAFKAIYGSVAGLQGMELLGHHLELELLKGNVPRVPIEGIHAANLHAIVDNLMQYEAMKNIWLPSNMKKELFFNILLLIITVSQIILGATQCDLLGHTIALAFTRAPTVSKVDSDLTSIDTEAIYEHVDAILASESNIWYICRLLLVILIPRMLLLTRYD